MSYHNYSCNNNQNYFVKKDRPTSRVLAPPGGHTSFSLGVAPPPAPKPAVTTVTTATTADKIDNSKSGKNNIDTLDVKKENVQEKLDQVEQNDVNKEEDEKEKDKQSKQIEPTEVKKVDTTTDPKKTLRNEVPISSNAFASGANINGAQVMTGRPTSRVLMPGGGGGPVSWKLG